jgi:HD superfamily phosphodiesterase
LLPIDSHRASVAALEQLCRDLFPEQAAILNSLVADAAALYRGESPLWQRCQVAYHNIEHVCAVTTVALQIYAGECCQRQLVAQLDQLKVLTVAALLHDSGYLKSRSDSHQGSGGQYTFEHVERSKRLAHEYLATRLDWSIEQRQAVVILIGATKIIAEPADDGGQQIVLAADFVNLVAMLASADLLAQVADKHYLEKLPLLYAEFAEAYACQGRENLRQRGFMVFDDYAQLLASSGKFIRQQVLPRLHALGDKELALQCLFNRQPSPYMLQLQTNLQRIDMLAVPV